jgi:hypothetical protein
VTAKMLITANIQIRRSFDMETHHLMSITPYLNINLGCVSSVSSSMAMYRPHPYLVAQIALNQTRLLLFQQVGKNSVFFSYIRLIGISIAPSCLLRP